MSSNKDIDAHFNRAVDIVQSLPKGGPVQTSYEEKLGLYALYKQGTEGDCSIPRPGILDLLGKAKWDSWNKQKGIDKVEAKRLYVNALLKILRKHASDDSVKGFLNELEIFAGHSRSVTLPARPISPASSISSYHSSQASPPLSPPNYMLPPDPSLPPPDVAPEIIPPSALTSSHRSLLNLAQSPPIDSGYAGPSGPSHIASRAHSLTGGRGGHDVYYGSGIGRGSSVHSFRHAPGFASAPPQDRSHGVSRPFDPSLPTVRDFLPHPRAHGPPQTPDMQPSPFLGIHQPTPIYPPRPGSTSTFSHLPPPPINLPQTLQQIQTSLTALHERLSTLERTQALILRRDERKRSWFWTSREDDELDNLEDEAARTRWASTTTVTRAKRKKTGLTIRVIWYLLTAVRRATIDLGVGMLVMLIGIVVLGGGWRRARWTLGRLRSRFERLITDAP